MRYISLLILFWAPRVFACSCEAPEFPDAVASAPAIYRGKVTKSESAGEGLRTISFNIGKTWKGKPSPTIVATHAPSVCETGFVVGSEYLVLESKDKPVTVDICSNTKLIAEASRELVYLDKRFAGKKSAKPGKVKRDRGAK